MADNLSNLIGNFVPTTNVWDVAQLQQVDVRSPEFKELLVRLYQNINSISLSLNSRDSGFYDLQEFVNGQLFFPNPSLTSSSDTVPEYRQVIRKVIDFGALPNATSKSVAHGITIDSQVTITRMYASATNPSTQFIPIPYASPTLANNIELSMDTTNVTITTGSNRTAFTRCVVILEYLVT
jgi:hypothetical protein